MTLADVMAGLAKADVVKVPRRDWPRLRRDFQETAAYETGLAGTLRIGKLEGTLVAVEEATAAHLAIRALRTTARARTFVKERLAAYDRMWDG
ncbi:MAG: hypothetical protein R3D98_08310 [Candidatus Krumholzibacteriia bacterium]